MLHWASLGLSFRFHCLCYYRCFRTITIWLLILHLQGSRLQGILKTFYHTSHFYLLVHWCLLSDQYYFSLRLSACPRQWSLCPLRSVSSTRYPLLVSIRSMSSANRMMQIFQQSMLIVGSKRYKAFSLISSIQKLKRQRESRILDRLQMSWWTNPLLLSVSVPYVYVLVKGFKLFH